MAAPSARRRIGFLDAARTLAMALMVQGHVCDNLLSPAGKASWFYQHYLPIRGLTAPLFFFVSGFAFVMASDPSWEEYGRPGPRLWGRLKRVASLCAVGWFLQIPRWSGPAYTTAEWHYVFRSGVLHAIAASLLSALVLIGLTRTRRRFTAWAAGLAATAVLVGALASTSGLSMPNLGLFVRTQEGSLFPIFPWMAHFLLGATAARLHLDTPSLSSTRSLALFVGAAGVILLSVAHVWLVLRPVNPEHLDVWVSDPAVFLSRAGRAWVVFAGLALSLGNVRSSAWLQPVAAHALSIYVAHLVGLYGWPGMDGLVQRIGPTLTVSHAYQVGPLLFLSCAVVVVALSFAFSFLERQAKAALAKLIALVREPAGGEPS